MTEQIGPGQGCGECQEHYGFHTAMCSRRYQPGPIDNEASLMAIADLLPSTFYAELPLMERVRRLVEGWRKLTRLVLERENAGPERFED